MLAIVVHNDVAVSSRWLKIWGTKNLSDLARFSSFLRFLGEKIFGTYLSTAL